MRRGRCKIERYLLENFAVSRQRNVGAVSYISATIGEGTAGRGFSLTW